MGNEEIDVIKNIRVHIVSDGPLTKGWIHTHGMDKFNLPELEMRNIPLFLMDDATHKINMICDYILNSAKHGICEGDTIQLGERSIVKLVKLIPIEGEEGHYLRTRWTIVDAMGGVCSECEKGTAHKH